jgi:hypothetical protein
MSQNSKSFSSWPTWPELFCAFGLFSALAAIHTYPLVFHLTDKTIAYYNAVGTPYLLAEQALILFETQFDLLAAYSPTVFQPLRHPFFYCNTSLFSSIVLGPIFVLSNNIYLLHNLFILSGMTLSAVGVFILARYLTHNSRAGLVAGSISSFSTINFYLFADTLFLNTYFLPMVAFFFSRYAQNEGKRHLVFVALLLALQFYNNSYHLVLAGFLLLFLSIHYRRTIFTIPNLPWIAICSSVTLLLIAPLAYQYSLFAFDIELQHDILLNSMSISPSEWFTVDSRNMLYSGLRGPEQKTASLEIHGSLFCGFMVTVLTIFALSRRASNRRLSILFFTLAVVIGIVATGWYPLGFFKQESAEPIFLVGLAKIIPPLSLFRAPFRLLTIVSMSLALVCAFGYVRIERMILLKIKSNTVIVFLLVISIINLENLAAPRQLYNYDRLYLPHESDTWIRKTFPTPSKDNLVLHIPSLIHAPLRDHDIPFDTLIYEYLTPLFRHLYHRFPMAGGRMSFVPDGWVSVKTRRLPSKLSQKYLRAIGVKTLIVHTDLLYETLGADLAEPKMIASGIKKIRSFEDGDTAYELDIEITRSRDLLINPSIADGQIAVNFSTSRDGLHKTPTRRHSCDLEIWHDTPLSCGAAGGVSSHDCTNREQGSSGCPEGQERIPANDTQVCCKEAEIFWRNPKQCAHQQMTIELQDGHGQLHRREFDYLLPLVVQNQTESPPVIWNLKEDSINGPIKLLSLETSCNEDYLLKSDNTSETWRLVRKVQPCPK